MIITNNADFHAYLTNRGVPCTYLVYPPDYYIEDSLVIVFPNTHVSNVSCNAHTNKYIDEYRKEMDNIVNWLECCEHIIMVTPVIKFDSKYMKDNAPKQYERLQNIKYHKQVIHERNIGSLINPSRLQLRYKGIDKINFDIVKHENLIDPMYEWFNKYGKQKQQQQHYMNVLYATKDKIERRKLRQIPRYTLYSQIYKKLMEQGGL
jgi:hypothetical protein